jgi:LysR family cys regulon transcriptional activator
MNLQQLRYFVATVDNGFNVSRAADAVQTSQPGISRQIKLLEQELGTTLFMRSPTRIVGLTESGERVLDIARRVLRDTDSLAQMGEDFLRRESGRLSIATVHTFALALLPRALARLRERYPAVTVELRQASPAAIIELVRAGEVDLGLSMRMQGLGDAGVVTLPVMETPRVLLTPKRHPLLKRDRVTLEELARHPFVAQTELSAGGWAVSSLFRSRGLVMQTAVMATDASLIKAHVESGVGIAIMSSLLFDPRRDIGLGAVDVSHLFEPSRVVLHIDPYRYLRGYVFELVRHLAPEWTRERVVAKAREFVDANGLPRRRGP